MKHKVKPWVRNVFIKDTYKFNLKERIPHNSKKSVKWALLFHIAPVAFLLMSLFTGGENNITSFLMGYVFNVSLFIFLLLAFYVFDVDWND